MNIFKIEFDIVQNYDDYQKINAIFKSYNDIDHKILNDNNILINGFYKSYILMDKKYLNNFEITPYYFVIDINDFNKKKIKLNLGIYNKNKKYKESFGKNKWIVKNTRSGRGIGTIIVNTKELYDLPNNIELREQLKEIQNNEKSEFVVQKYLEEPYLYKDKKCDLRVFVYVENNQNNKIEFYLYNQIIARYVSKKFDIESNDRLIHLTNLYVSKKDNIFVLNEEIDQYKYNKIKENIINQLQIMFNNNNFKKYFNQNKIKNVFEIFALDILLDNNMNTWIIDFNTCPTHFYHYDYIQLYTSSWQNTISFKLISSILLKILQDKQLINVEQKKAELKQLDELYGFQNLFTRLQIY